MPQTPICFECVHCMKLKMVVSTPLQDGPMRGHNAVQTIIGAACKLSSVPIGGPTTTLECSEFQQREGEIVLKKPEKEAVSDQQSAFSKHGSGGVS
jgi:hypothetical protein